MQAWFTVTYNEFFGFLKSAENYAKELSKINKNMTFDVIHGEYGHVIATYLNGEKVYEDLT